MIVFFNIERLGLVGIIIFFFGKVVCSVFLIKVDLVYFFIARKVVISDIFGVFKIFLIILIILLIDDLKKFLKSFLEIIILFRFICILFVNVVFCKYFLIWYLVFFLYVFNKVIGSFKVMLFLFILGLYVYFFILILFIKSR